MKINHKGFGIVEVLLAIIAVTLLVGVGYYVTTNTSKRANTNLQQSSNVTPATEDKTAQAKENNSQEGYLVIKELGFKIKLTDKISDLIYVVETETSNPGGPYKIARISSKQIAAIDPQCGPESSVLGLFTKKDGHYQESEFENASFYKRFDGYHIAYYEPRSSCSVKEEAGKIQYELRSIMIEAAKTLEEL